MISLSSLAQKEKTRIKIVVGTVVSTNLYGLGRGVVYHIHGEQMPETVKQLGGGIVMAGGHAEFDIVHDCGKFSKRLPECILRGVQWEFLDDIADVEEIQNLCTRAEKREADEKREKEELTARFNADVERLKTAPEYAHLEQGECSSGKLAAKNIRRELKQFKGIKFPSVIRIMEPSMFAGKMVRRLKKSMPLSKGIKMVTLTPCRICILMWLTRSMMYLGR